MSETVKENDLKAMEAASWSIRANQFDQSIYYGAMVANGFIGIVSDLKPMAVKEVVLNGVYDRYQRGRVSNILKGINPFNLRLDVDGRNQGMAELIQYEQVLNMKQASFNSHMEGEKCKVNYELMALRHLPFCSMLSIEVQAKQDLEFTLFNEIESPDHLRDVRNYFSEIDRPHVKIPLLSTVAKSPSGRISLAASNSYIFEEAHGEEPDLIHEDWDFNRHLVKFSKKLHEGQTYRFTIVVSICTTVQTADPQNEAERLSIYAKMEGRDRLLHRHLEAWKKLWKSDIQLDGDPQVQLEIRLMLYYLYSSVRAGTALSLSPVGLSGLGYNGHVFWDTELWMYPALLVMHPEIAKSILDYRFDRIEAARKNAFKHGFKGLMFPWESADDGSEQTPVWALTGPFQQHITACVAWAFWKYFQLTQDKTWLREKGYIVLKGSAEFWCSRVERNGPGNYDIKNVIGANEFEENIDNNAFTNGIVKTVLQFATEAAEILGLEADPDWLHVAENIPILQFEDGTTKENATYDGAEIKQADVNLLAFPLDLISEEEQILKDLNFYEPRMSPEGPAMGFATLATLRAKMGEWDRAYEIFIRSYRSNGLPPFGLMAECADGKGVSPYFVTGAGGALQAVLFGFLNLTLDQHGLKQGEPRLPKKVKQFKLTLEHDFLNKT
ncbi:MAG: glycoside hydrolase family 65 protein [Bacteroidia bacterium]|nr:glycoside hydrolase family 65 protein [Bacteroidia bacterium]